MDDASLAYCDPKSIKIWSQPKIVMTGFCGSGCHEGTKPVSHNGKAMRTCPFWEACICPCHEKITQLFKMTDTPRTLVENPDYVRPVNTFWMPGPEDYTHALEAAPEIIEGGGISLAPKVVTTTASGRTNRGGLEYLVQRECLLFLDQPAVTHCTPRYLSDEIARTEGIKPPSLGAIDAVLKRWVACGYAVVDRSPTRFTSLTDEGRTKGLEYLKAVAKAKK